MPCFLAACRVDGFVLKYPRRVIRRSEVIGMPNYDFRCENCGHIFSKMAAIAEKDSVTCPKCGGKVKQLFTGFAVMKGSSSSSCSSAGTPSCSAGAFG